MNITSGSQYRNFASQNEFNFSFSVTNSTSSGISNLGFSGSNGESLNLFRFQSGKIFDFNNRYIWGYNPREEINISGNIGPQYLNYFINTQPVCLFSPHGTGYYDNFYINTNNSTVDFDFFINGTLPAYSFEYDNSLEMIENLTGYIKNTSYPLEKSFKIFSGEIFNINLEYDLDSFNSGIISGGTSGQFILKPVNVSVSETTSGNLTLLLYTNFGTISQDISFNVYPSPIYFTDFITGYTGLLGLKDDFTLEKLYNFQLNSIYPTNRTASFILQNISGHTGQEIYDEFAASGFVSGRLSEFIYGFDYITGTAFGSGISISQQDYYGQFPTGVFKVNLSIEQNATGDIIYNYNLPIYGGYGTGIASSGISITGSGYLTGIETFSGFVYGQQNLYYNQSIDLTGYYGELNSINIKTGVSDIYLPVSFTGSGYIDYSKFLWSCNFVTGTGYFSGESFSGSSNRIIGITGERYLFIDSGQSGAFYFNTTSFRNQTSGEVLIPIIGQNTGLFKNSGKAYGVYGSTAINTTNIFSGEDINAAVTGQNYFYFYPESGAFGGFVFSFDDYNPKDRGTIRYISFELDKNALYTPGSTLRLQLSSGNISGTWPFTPTANYNFETLSNNDLYNSSNNTYFLKITNLADVFNNNNTYTRARLLVRPASLNVWPHQSTGNNNLIKAIGIKNFQLYRSIPVSQLSGLSSLQYPINTNNMTGYNTPSGNLLYPNSYSGTVIQSQDSLEHPAWHAFNSNKTLYPYADIVEGFDGKTTVGYALNNPIRKLFSGFFVEFFDGPSTPTYIGVEVSQDGTNYYECYNKTGNIQLIETGSFRVGTGYQYFRLNFTPIPSCVNSPYADACYQQVITQYPSCCDTVWDSTCELTYQGCTGGFPPEEDPPIYTGDGTEAGGDGFIPLGMSAGSSDFDNMCLRKASAGNLHSFLINNKGYLEGWGSEAGINLLELPEDALYGSGIFIDIAIGGGTTINGNGFNVLLEEDRTISAWGKTFGNSDISSPTENQNYGFVKVGATLSTAIAKRYDNSLYLWGDVNIGNVIRNSAGTQYIMGADATNYFKKNIIDFSYGYYHILLQNTGESLEGLTDRGINYFNAGTIPEGLGKVKLFAAGYGYSLALKENGTMTGWGVNGVNDLDGLPPNNTQQDVRDFYGSGQLNIPQIINQFGSGISGNILKLYGGNGYAAALVTGVTGVNLISGIYTWGSNPWYSGVPNFIPGAKDISIGRRSMLIINSGDNLIYYGFNSGWNNE